MWVVCQLTVHIRSHGLGADLLRQFTFRNVYLLDVALVFL